METTKIIFRVIETKLNSERDFIKVSFQALVTDATILLRLQDALALHSECDTPLSEVMYEALKFGGYFDEPSFRITASGVLCLFGCSGTRKEVSYIASIKRDTCMICL